MTSSIIYDSKEAQNITAASGSANLPVATEQAPQLHAFGQAAFWRPRHMAASAVLGQLPFLFWLTEVTAPRLILQVGLDDGIGYLALCQAAERLNNSTICVALDSRTTALTPALQAEHDGHYSDFSQILSEEKAISSLPEGIDLLVIGGAPEADVLRDAVLPRLSESAVVVIMKPDEVLADQATRTALLGNDRLRMSLGPVMTGGTALDVILYGKKQPDHLRRLIAQSPGQSAWLAMRQAFNRLGQGVVAIQQTRDLSRDQNAWKTRLERAETEYKTLAKELQKAEASEKVQHQRQAEMAAKMHDLQKAVSNAEDAYRALQSEREDLIKELEELVHTKDQIESEKNNIQENFAAQLAEMQRDLEYARAEHNTRIEDIAIITGSYEKDRKETEKKALTQLSQANRQLVTLRDELAEISAHRDALLNSTSWKLTSPLRKVISAMRRH